MATPSCGNEHQSLLQRRRQNQSSSSTEPQFHQVPLMEQELQQQEELQQHQHRLESLLALAMGGLAMPEQPHAYQPHQQLRQEQLQDGHRNHGMMSFVPVPPPDAMALEDPDDLSDYMYMNSHANATDAHRTMAIPTPPMMQAQHPSQPLGFSYDQPYRFGSGCAPGTQPSLCCNGHCGANDEKERKRVLQYMDAALHLLDDI